ncbi:MAG TPA: recombinase family protein, partial [Solirubrobacteraceae bacterium]|nr:recombinase family protein [Solirubrobacteraceae bacterium]
METWAGIVRVSSVGGRNGDSFHSDADQVADVERYAAQHGARVVFMGPELSVSGGDPIEQRPSLRAGIEGVEAGIYDGVVVAYLSRLTRSHSGRAIWDRVEAAGGHVHAAAENLDTSTPNGAFIRDIHLANAVREREE